MKIARIFLVGPFGVLALSACTGLLGDDFEVVVSCREDPSICFNPHGSSICVQGACKPVCERGFGNCDGDDSTGCETDLAGDQSHCGQCGLVCEAPRATSQCRDGACRLLECETGFGDCNGEVSDGCEVELAADGSHCGACGTACQNPHGTTRCVTSLCEPVCDQGFADCDGVLENGCETDLGTSTDNCGSCGRKLPANEVCVGGMPIQAALCPSTHRDCNNDALTDGCEVDVSSDPLNCGACSRTCEADSVCVQGGCVTCTIFSEDFGSPRVGSWALDDPWQIGAAMAGGGGACTKPALECGAPDPASDTSSTGDNALAGVVLGGNYPTNEPGPFYLTSPTIDLRGTGRIELNYFRWLNSDAPPYVTNVVQAFDGDTWKTVWTSPVGTMPMIATGWTQVTYDLTPFKNQDDQKNAGFRLRFGFSVGRADAFFYSGWNIDDVVIRRSGCGMLP